MRKTEPDIEWQAAIKEAWQRHKLGTYGQAERKTGIERTVLFRWRSKGEKPSKETAKASVIKWAVAIGENVNHWLREAGLSCIPEQLVVRETPAPYITDDLLAEMQKRYNVLDEDMEVIREIVKRSKEESK